MVVDKLEETKTYIYEVSNDKGLDNEKEFDTTSFYWKHNGASQRFYTKVETTGILESIAWHPNEENVLFVSRSLEGRSNHVYFQAKNVEDSETLFEYNYFHRPKLAIGKKNMIFKKRTRPIHAVIFNFREDIVL